MRHSAALDRGPIAHMQTLDTQHASAGGSPAEDHARSSLRELNVRVIRLAIALGVSLDSEPAVQRVLQRAAAAASVPLERRTGTERRTGSRAARGPDRRVGHLFDELRGLLVLRYGLHKRCLDELGIDATRRIVSTVRAELAREGFRPELAGIELDIRFDTA
jgi:hypothetical protein